MNRRDDGAPEHDRHRLAEVMFVVARAGHPVTAAGVTRSFGGVWCRTTVRDSLNELAERGVLVRWKAPDCPAAPFYYTLDASGPDSIDLDIVGETYTDEREGELP